MEYDSQNLPEYQAWVAENGPEFSLLDFVYHGKSEHVVAMTALFWPAFVEYEGGVFLRDGFDEDNCRDWMERLGDIRAVEATLNHRELGDLLGDIETIGEENIVFLGLTIRQMWWARLNLLYPDRSFLVEFEANEDEAILSVQSEPSDP